MTTTNEPKYKIENGKIVNRATNIPVPDDEPLFILRGRDRHAVATLNLYLKQIPIGTEHERAVILRRSQFERFAQDNSSRMKEPDTTLTSDWT